MNDMKKSKKTILSVCLSCRDGRENYFNSRGGERFAKKIFKSNSILKEINLRGINCMSNCSRSCVLSITSEKGFTFIFGDIDHENIDYLESLSELISQYDLSLEGFLRRRDRPRLFQSNIIGRLPPIGSSSNMVTNLNNGFNDE